MRKSHLFLVPVALCWALVGALAQQPAATVEPAAAPADKKLKLTEDPEKTAEAVKLESTPGPGAEDDEPSSSETFAKSASAGLDNEEIFSKFTPDERAKLTKLLQDASAYVAGIRLQEAFEKLIEAESMAPDLFAIHNLKGAAYTKMRDFKSARTSFERALKIAPEAFMARFNLLELNFVEGHWEAAEKGFQGLISETKEMNAATKGLIEFKIYITRLKQNDLDGADALLRTFNYLSDSPEYYYANAAKHFHAEEKEEAHKWMRSAEKIYKKRQQEIFLDSLIEVGWLDNLQ